VFTASRPTPSPSQPCGKRLPFSRVKELAAILHLISSLRTHGAVPPLHTSSWHGENLAFILHNLFKTESTNRSPIAHFPCKGPIRSFVLTCAQNSVGTFLHSLKIILITEQEILIFVIIIDRAFTARRKSTTYTQNKRTHIQGIHKRMIRFQKLTKSLFLALYGHTIHRQRRKLSKFLMRYQQFASHAYCVDVCRVTQGAHIEGL
jgi:hypothetical protein